MISLLHKELLGLLVVEHNYCKWKYCTIVLSDYQAILRVFGQVIICNINQYKWKHSVSVQVIRILFFACMYLFVNRWFSGESVAECYVFTSGSGERSRPSSWPHSWPQVPWNQSDGNPDWDDHQLLTISNKYTDWVE